MPPVKYWRNLEEYAGDARVEAPDESPPDEASRRKFIQLMGASFALAGAGACTRQPPEFIVPYVEPPESAIPGRPTYFASAAPMNGVAQGVIVETHLGRPTKIEGNPDHPASLGATSVNSQASVLDLYDPDRAREITYLGEARSWLDFLNAFRAALEPLRAKQGEGFSILTETIVSHAGSADRGCAGFHATGKMASIRSGGTPFGASGGSTCVRKAREYDLPARSRGRGSIARFGLSGLRSGVNAIRA